MFDDQEVENQLRSTWEGYVDWRGKPATRLRHGGMLAASFVLGTHSLSHSFSLSHTQSTQKYCEKGTMKWWEFSHDLNQQITFY